MLIDKITIAEIIKEHIKELDLEKLVTLIETPPPEINFTYAFPCFQLAKSMKKSPNLIAQDLAEKVSHHDIFKSVEASGPYLNFKVKPEYILKNIFKFKENYGIIRDIDKQEARKKVKIVIEYPSPNTNKPLHIGHIRNMLLGKSLANLLIYEGHKVYQINLYNDRGIHICKSMLAYKKWGRNKQPDKKPDHFVGDYYVKFSQMAETDENLNKENYDLLRSWEAGDEQTITLWNKMRKWALEGFEDTYKKIGISFDKVFYESDLYLKGKEIIYDGLEKGLFEKTEDGAIFVSLKEKYNLPDKFLIRSDGTAIYITQDIYFAYKKKEDFDYSRSIYIVGDEQIQHFKWLFAILDLLGFKEDNFHLSYGMIDLPSGRMKSREGEIADGDDLIEELEQLAYHEVNKRYKNISESEKTRRANIIGIAGLKFFILKHNPSKGFVFNPKESISFEGETGPYIQYCFARIESIIAKSGVLVNLNIDWDLLSHEKELILIKYLTYYPEVVNATYRSYDVHLIAQYLLTLCQTFNSFYTSCQVISDNSELERARLLLIRCVQIVIKQGLDILGIDTLNQM